MDQSDHFLYQIPAQPFQMASLSVLAQHQHCIPICGWEHCWIHESRFYFIPYIFTIHLNFRPSSGLVGHFRKCFLHVFLWRSIAYFHFLLLILHIQAFLMIIFDIFWMLCMTFVFDRVFGQPDFSLRDIFSCYSPANVRTRLIDSNLLFEKFKIK